MWWAWLAWKLDLCDDVVKQNPMISIFRKLGCLKSDRGSSPLRPPLDPPLELSKWRQIKQNQKCLTCNEVYAVLRMLCLQLSSLDFFMTLYQNHVAILTF